MKSFASVFFCFFPLQMEKTSGTKLQEQEHRVVTPTKKEATQARGWKVVAKKRQARGWKEPTKKKVGDFEGLTKVEHKECFPLPHYDARWYRTVWYCDREKQYKPRDPSKGVEWSRPEGWRPESPEEMKKRLKIRRLQHDQAKVGAVYNYFGKPDQKVRVVQVFEGGPAQLNVFPLSGNK